MKHVFTLLAVGWLSLGSTTAGAICQIDPAEDLLVPQGGTGVIVQENSRFGTPIRGAISGSYVPPYNIVGNCDYAWWDPTYVPVGTQASLHDAARLLGYDHFNWLQVVVHTPYPMPLPGGKISHVPYIDPPLGGNKYQWWDDQVYLYDERMPTLTERLLYNYLPGYHIDDYTDEIPNTLQFEDQPSRAFQPGEFNHYVTHLVGVKSAIKWDIIDTFDWFTDYNRRTGAGHVWDATRPEDHPEATGGVYGLRENIALEDLPDSYKRFLVGLGADNIPLSGAVPEPSALSLLLVGWLSLVVSRRRARSLTQAKSFKLGPRR